MQRKNNSINRGDHNMKGYKI